MQRIIWSHNFSWSEMDNGYRCGSFMCNEPHRFAIVIDIPKLEEDNQEVIVSTKAEQQDVESEEEDREANVLKSRKNNE